MEPNPKSQLQNWLVRAIFRPPRVAPRAVERILVVRPDQVGDLLFATPALARLREAFPSAHIAGLVGPWGRAAWQSQPMLDDLIVCDFPGIVRRPPQPWQPYTLLRTVAADLRRQRFDLALILRFDYWWGALLAQQAAIPWRWGYGLPALRPFLSTAVPYWPGRHEVEQNLTLVEKVVEAGAGWGVPVLHGELGPVEPWPVQRDSGQPPLRFPIATSDHAWAAAAIPRRPDGGPGVAIQPGSNASVKLWTPDGWAAVATWLLDRGLPVLFTGTAGEAPLIEAIRARLAPGAVTFSLAGQTSLGQLAAVFALQRLVLGVDNGPLHLATAVGTPTVRLYGPSDEWLWGPWGPAQRHRVVRAPGTLPSGDLQPGRVAPVGGPTMLAITPDQVITAASAVLAVA